MPRVLLLGVTPELYRLPWPEGTQLLAVDRTQAMIDYVWPGPPDSALCSGWTELPLPDASRELMLCDGGLGMMDYPEGQARLAGELRRVVSEGGLCVFRLFAPPEERESVQDVLGDLKGGRIPGLRRLASELGWSVEHVLTVNMHRDSSERSCWSGVGEVRRLFCESTGGFEMESVEVPPYELGDCCPIVALRRIPASP